MNHFPQEGEETRSSKGSTEVRPVGDGSTGCRTGAGITTTGSGRTPGWGEVSPLRSPGGVRAPSADHGSHGFLQVLQLQTLVRSAGAKQHQELTVPIHGDGGLWHTPRCMGNPSPGRIGGPTTPDEPLPLQAHQGFGLVFVALHRVEFQGTRVAPNDPGTHRGGHLHLGHPVPVGEPLTICQGFAPFEVHKLGVSFDAVPGEWLDFQLNNRPLKNVPSTRGPTPRGSVCRLNPVERFGKPCRNAA